MPQLRGIAHHGRGVLHVRLAVWFAREEAARYVSHLDIQSAFGRALRRSGLPIRYSQGFNPHPVLAFALAVPGGYTFDENWMDIALTETMSAEDALAKLKPQMPPGFRAVWGCALEDSHPPLMPLITGARYAISFENSTEAEKFAAGMSELMASESFSIQKHTKSGFKMVDVRHMVREFAVEGDSTFCLSLAAGNEGGLNPRLLLRQFVPECITYAVHIRSLEQVRGPLGYQPLG